MDGSFTTDDIKVGPKDIDATTATKEYQVSASLCNAPPGGQGRFKQGEIIEVCITLKDPATADGVEFQELENFYWTRTNITPQKACCAGVNEEYNALSSIEVTGSKITVSSVLYATFFASNGSVKASGSTKLGFQSSCTNTCDPLCCEEGNSGVPVPAYTSAWGMGDTFWSDIEDYINTDSSIYGNRINCWNVAQVQDMEFAFNYVNFNEPLTCWDTSSVTSMELMFDSSTEFNQDISSWNLSSLQRAEDMFHDASSFNQDLCSWDVYPTNMVFYNSGCPNQNDPTEYNYCHDCVRRERVLISNKDEGMNKKNNKERRKLQVDEDIPPSGFNIEVDLTSETDGPVKLIQADANAIPDGLVCAILGIIGTVLLFA